MKHGTIRRNGALVSALLGLFMCSPTASASGGRRGHGHKKVELCHVPPGNPAGAHTIRVSVKAAKRYLRHNPGDSLGKCPSGCASGDDCNDNNPCTVDVCDPATGACDNSGQVDCDDGNDCTQNGCDPTVGCVASLILVDSPCDDEDICTVGELCDAHGACGGGAPVPNCCSSAADCDDGDACTGDHCTTGNVCLHTNDVVCNAGDCEVAICNPSTGQCETTMESCPTDPTDLCKVPVCIANACIGGADLCSFEDTVCGEGEVCNSGTGQCELAGNRVFVTDSLVRAQNIGGLDGADARCQAGADAANIGGTWKAWLSTSTVNAKDRIDGSGPYVRMDGALIANDLADLTDGSIAVAINLSEFGAQPDGGFIDFTRVWTGTDTNGEAADVTFSALISSFCFDWTGEGGNQAAHRGEYTRTDAQWTIRSDAFAICNSLLRLYCFESD